jgi:hypothetical protein
MTKRSTLMMLGGLAGALFLPPMFTGISLGGHEPKVKEMIEKGDHAALAEYYKKEAEDARHKADGMKEMASDYLKKYPKNTYAKHCEKMEERYRAEAKELEALAEQHAKAAKGGK